MSGHSVRPDDHTLESRTCRYVGQGEWGPIIQFPLVPAAAAVYNNKVPALAPV